MSTSYYKEPAPPTGGDPIATWARQFQQWSKQFLLRGVKGARTKPDPNGGLHIIIPKTIIPPNQPQTFTNYYPFKIYQPANLSFFIGQTVTTMIGSDPNNPALLPCKIVDANTPTDLTKNPQQISIGDKWRFWSVRDGYIEVRSNYFIDINPLPSFLNNYALAIVPDQCDGVTESPFGPTSFAPKFPFDKASTVVLNPPLVIGINPSAENDLTAILWAEVIEDTSIDVLPSVQIRGYCSPDSSDNVLPGFYVTSRNDIPIGVIVAQPVSSIVGVNYVFDNCRNRYAVGNGNFPTGKGNGTVTNYRGTVTLIDSPLSGTTEPADLADQLFYPGDILWYYEVGAADNIVYNSLWQFTGKSPAFPQTSDGVPYPPSDSNFTKIFGASAGKDT